MWFIYKDTTHASRTCPYFNIRSYLSVLIRIRDLIRSLSRAHYFRKDDYLVGFPHSYYSCFSCLFPVTLDSLMTLVRIRSTLLTLGRTALFIILIHIIILSILVVCLPTNPGYFYQYLIITILSIHNLSECVTGIFRLVTFDDIIRDSGILDIIPSSFYHLPELSLWSFSRPRWDNLPSGHQRHPLLRLNLGYMYWGQKHSSE